MAAGIRHQVFVSSTYTDLKDERREIIQALLQLDCIPVGMELFPAASTDQWTYIQRVIDDSDYYVVIVAGRYGSTTEDGLSFTEREYDYALSKGIPVAAFVHRDIGELPGKHLEENEVLRKKLQAFRDKVRRRLCKEWGDSKELALAVMASLWKLRQDEPREGWVRGGTASDPATLNRLREHVADLEAEVNRIRTSPPEGADRLSSGLEPVHLRMVITHLPQLSGLEMVDYRKLQKKRDADIQTTWDEILRTIGPGMLEESSEPLMFERLQTHFFSKEPPLEGFSSHPSLLKEDFETVLIQLKALGLMERSPKKHTASDCNTYWRLTTYGEMKVTQLKAISKQHPF